MNIALVDRSIVANEQELQQVGVQINKKIDQKNKKQQP